MRVLLATMALTMASSAAHAAFIVDTDIYKSNEIHATLDAVIKKNPVTTVYGSILQPNDLKVTLNAPGAVVNNSIVPMGDSLTSVTFTPLSSKTFTDFSFVCQFLTNNEAITLTVLDTHGATQTFQVPTGLAAGNMKRFGIEALPGDAIKSVTITAAQGLRDLKNPFFSVNAVPEPSSWAMLITGVGMVGAVMRRKLALAA